MAGRVRGVAVSSSSVVVAVKMLDRTSLVFSCGEPTNLSSVVLKDEDDATVSNGFPLLTGQIFVVTGQAARHRWSAIRLAALDCVVGVLEGYPDRAAVEPDFSGIPS